MVQTLAYQLVGLSDTLFANIFGQFDLLVKLFDCLYGPPIVPATLHLLKQDFDIDDLVIGVPLLLTQLTHQLPGVAAVNLDADSTHQHLLIAMSFAIAISTVGIHY